MGVVPEGLARRAPRRARRSLVGAVMAAVPLLMVGSVPAAGAEADRPPPLREAEVPVTSAWVGAEGMTGTEIAIGAEAAAAVLPGVDRAIVDSLTRMYLAVFGRLPDAAGHRYWVERHLGGDRLVDMAAGFMASPEWSNRYGPVEDGPFVELLYRHVLDRLPDPGGDGYWRSTLAGGISRAEVLVQFSQSPEFVRRTGTTPPRPPYPPVPAGSGAGRRIVYANTAQRVWLIEADGSVDDSYLVSGRRDTPDPGTYRVYSKSPRAWAGHGGITMDHMVRFARGRSLAIGFHSIPTRASGVPLQGPDQLGTYQSAGCVRQRADKAAALYRWADIGTTVVVVD